MKNIQSTLHSETETFGVCAFFFIALTLWNCAYLPGILYTPFYQILTFSSYGLWIIFFFARIGRFVPLVSHDGLARIYLCAAIWQTLMFVLGMGFGLAEATSENYFIPVLSSFLCFFIGYVSKGTFSARFWFVYSLPVAAVALYTCVFRLDSLEIQTTYAVDAKNSLGPIWGLTAIGAAFFAVQRGRLVSASSALAFFFTACCVISRARTAFLGLAFIFALIICMRYFKKNLFTIFLGGFLLCIAVAILFQFDNPFTEFVADSLFKGRDIDDLDSVSSGRVERMIIAWDAFTDSPITGLWGSGAGIPWSHNFLLNVLSARGIFGGLGCIVLYLALCVTTITGFSRIRAAKNLENHHLGYFLLLYILIVSLAEPTYPFSPTTVCGIAFICLGQSLKNRFRAKVPQRRYSPFPPDRPNKVNAAQTNTNREEKQ